jgi:hypothetical protein
VTGQPISVPEPASLGLAALLAAALLGNIAARRRCTTHRRSIAAGLSH